jgi:hypothetical protein
MSCFWQGVIQALAKANMLQHHASPVDFSKFLRDNNALTIGVQWQGGPLTLQALQENFERVASCDGTTNDNEISNGYMTSSCDPFLLLVSHLFEVDITHEIEGSVEWARARIEYRAKASRSAVYHLKFGSSTGHFYHKG